MTGRQLRVAFVLIVFIFMALATYFSVMVLKDAFIERITTRVSGSITVNEIDFDFFPLTIDIESPVIRPTDSTKIRFETLQVNPDFSSIYSDTVIINSIDLHKPVFTVDTRTIVSDKIGVPDNLFSNESKALAKIGKAFHIKTINIFDGTLVVSGDKSDFADTLVLPDIRGTISQIKIPRFLEPIEVDLSSGSDNVLNVEGKILPGANERIFQGDLGIRKMEPSRIKQFFPTSFVVKNGTMNAHIPITLGRTGVSLGAVDFSTDGLVAEYNHSEDTVSRAPVKSDTGSLNFSVDSFTGVLSKSKVSLPDIPDHFEIKKGVFEVGSWTSRQKTVPVRSRMELSNPKGFIQYKGTIVRDSEPLALDVVAHGSTSNISSMNAFSHKYLPFRFVRGSLKTATRGTISPNNLDLAVQVSFTNLKIKNSGEKSGQFLGIPNSVLLEYLSNTDGSLDVKFKINGTPLKPEVDISTLRQRLFIELGVDAAVISSLGFPVFVGNEVLDQVIGINLIDKTRSILKGIFAGNKGPALKGIPEDTVPKTVLSGPTDRSDTETK